MMNDDIFCSTVTLMQVCYVAFWDEITLAAQEAAGHKIGKDNFIGHWRIVLVRNLPFRDQRLNGKIPKVGKLYMTFCYIYSPEFKHNVQSPSLCNEK